MKYYPVFLDIKDKKCLVVGAGSVGIRKAVRLEKCGARVTVVSLDIKASDIGEHPGILFEQKAYETDDIIGKFFVFAATDNAGLNHTIQKDAQSEQILCNVADAPEKSDFLLPSVVESGDLAIAVSTSGKSPAMARTIKNELRNRYGEEYAVLLNLMGEVRKELLSQGHDPETHKKIFYDLIQEDLLKMILKKDHSSIEAILSKVLGNEFKLRAAAFQKE